MLIIWVKTLCYAGLLIKNLPLLHCRRWMIKPGKVTDHRFVVAVIAFAYLHCSDLCQAHFQVPPEGVLVQRLTAGLHMALRTKLGRG